MSTAEQVLTMPLEELRERAELAERICLAARLTPPGTYAASGSAVNTAQPAATPAKPRRTKAQIDADNAAAAGTGASTTTAAAATAPSADELMLDLAPDPAPASGGDLVLDAGDDGDMLAGFEALEAEMSIDDLKTKVNEIVSDIVAKKDTARLTVARAMLVKFGVQKASEVPDDKLREFYDGLPK